MDAAAVIGASTANVTQAVRGRWSPWISRQAQASGSPSGAVTNNEGKTLAKTDSSPRNAKPRTRDMARMPIGNQAKANAAKK